MKIGTWNMQGYSCSGGTCTFGEAIHLMLHNDLDVFCLQETGTISENGTVVLNDPNFIKTEFNIGTTSRPFRVNCYNYVFVGKQNDRCSLTILIKCEADAGHPAIFYNGINLRPVIGVLMTNGNMVYDMHAPSTNGRNLTINYVKNAIQEVSNFVREFALVDGILVGDFNATPEKITDAINGDQNVNANIFAPQNSSQYVQTHNSGNCLDYCCCINNNCMPAISVNCNASYSDHRAVIFNFS